MKEQIKTINAETAQEFTSMREAYAALMHEYTFLHSLYEEENVIIEKAKALYPKAPDGIQWRNATTGEQTIMYQCEIDRFCDLQVHISEEIAEKNRKAKTDMLNAYNAELDRIDKILGLSEWSAKADEQFKVYEDLHRSVLDRDIECVGDMCLWLKAARLRPETFEEEIETFLQRKVT